MPVKSQVNFEEQFKKYLIVNSFKEEKKRESADNARITFGQFDKQISQVIAKSWLIGGEGIQKALLGGDSDIIKVVFREHGVDIDGFFAPLTVNVYVNWDTFYGGLSEVGEQSLQLNIPYPPKPMQISDDDLMQWVDDSDPNTVFPPHAFIPLSCC